MKKLTTLLILLASFTFFSTSALAVEAEGVIQELKQCRTGGPWKILLFKIEGNWFALNSDYYNNTNNGVNDYVGSSMIISAFTAGYTVKVNATGVWNVTYSACGDATGHAIHLNKGDYVQLIK
jgi:hypothetical protein